MSLAVNTHEVKSQPGLIPQTKIVEAYGLMKCPKLVEQVAGMDIDVRINALAVLCDEFNNPYSISGCAQAGVIKVLSSMVTDPDYTTRERASRALALAAKDANGLDSILVDEVVGDILQGREDPSEVVRGNVYETLLHVTRTRSGVDACNIAGVTKVFVEAISQETSPALKDILLRALYNIVGTEDGLIDAINAGAVEICISLLSKSEDVNVNCLYGSAAKTLALICFDERGKDVALESEINGGAIKSLLQLIYDLKASFLTNSIKSAILTAIMAITSTDEGKRQMNDVDGINSLVAMLYEDDRIVRLNAVKVIANVAVYPPIRKQFQESNCLVNLKRMKVSGSGDKLLEKQVNIAIDAVNWRP